VVSVKATLSQQGDIAVGNVIGSNTFNIAVILGLTALLCPIPVQRQVIRIDAPIALGCALVLVLLLLDGALGRVEGALLFAGMLAYVGMNVVLAQRSAASMAGAEEEEAVPGLSRHWGVDVALIAVGLAVLVMGSRLLVDHSVSLARDLGIGEAVIGLTIVAAGTSMPELATSLVAAFRRQVDIAIGNVIGSNVFNVLGILGIASLVSPLDAPGVSMLDSLVMLAFTVLLIPLLYTGRMLHRIEGVLLLALYGVYLFVLWPA
jgi:cation:H+ antiporter